MQHQLNHTKKQVHVVIVTFNRMYCEKVGCVYQMPGALCMRCGEEPPDMQECFEPNMN